MAGEFITIQDAAELSGKSIQTIRRAIKSKKIAHRRKKTPQGFHYMIGRESIIEFYKLRVPREERLQGRLKSAKTSMSEEFATVDDLKKVQSEISALLDEHEKAKESFMRFMKTFQEKFMIMENQMKLLEDPKQKRWFEFWR